MQVNKLLQYSALAVFIGAGVGVAHADEATTTGGIKIKSSDGNFDASIGGRIHFDGEVIEPDHGAKFGANDPAGGEKSSFYFRRAFISLAGHLYGWEYHIDEDLAATSTNGFNDVWVAHSVIGSDAVYFGQHKPWRSLDELASNNITPFMERNIASATGVYGGRDFTDGVFYKWTHGFTGSDNFFAGASVYTLGKTANTSPAGGSSSTNPNGTSATPGGALGSTFGQTEGTGYNARIAYAPLIGDGYWAHVGVTAESDNADANAVASNNTNQTNGYSLSSTYIFVGRQGATATIASYGGGSPKGNNPNVTLVSGELAGAFGPVYASGEFVNAKYNQTGKVSDTVQAFSGTVAWAITGESRPYDKSVATYGAIKPKHAYGAVEVLARFDWMRNDGGNGSTPTFVGGGSGATAERVYAATAGVTYYPNPAVRFMLNYMHGGWDQGGTLGKDNPNSVEGRVALSF
jgi:phosphate-selective porin OprO/OprP